LVLLHPCRLLRSIHKTERLLSKVVTMSFFPQNNGENANEALTLKQPSFASSSDKNLSDNLSSSVATNSNNLQPPMGQSSDLGEEEEANECEDPAMCQPSDLEVESTEGTVDSASSLSSYYLPFGLLATLKKKQGMNQSQPEFEIGFLPPPNHPPKTLNDGSPNTALTVLCDAGCRPDFSSDSSDDDTVLDLYSPPFKKQKTLDTNSSLGSDSSDDDRKETVIERNIRLRREKENVEYDDLMKRGSRLVHKARKVSASGLTRSSPTRLFCDSDDSNSPVSLMMLPSCFVKYASIPWPAAANHPDLIANDEESDDDFSRDLF
jgi:hypothetical protein